MAPVTGGGKKRPHLKGRFSGRLETKDDEKLLADECKLLGPLLGGAGKNGDNSRLTLAKIVRGIAAGDVRRHCEEREMRIQFLEEQNKQAQAEIAELRRRLGEPSAVCGSNSSTGLCPPPPPRFPSNMPVPVSEVHNPTILTDASGSVPSSLHLHSIAPTSVVVPGSRAASQQLHAASGYDAATSTRVPATLAHSAAHYPASVAAAVCAPSISQPLVGSLAMDPLTRVDVGSGGMVSAAVPANGVDWAEQSEKLRSMAAVHRQKASLLHNQVQVYNEQIATLTLELQQLQEKMDAAQKRKQQLSPSTRSNSDGSDSNLASSIAKCKADLHATQQALEHARAEAGAQSESALSHESALSRLTLQRQSAAMLGHPMAVGAGGAHSAMQSLAPTPAVPQQVSLTSTSVPGSHDFNVHGHGLPAPRATARQTPTPSPFSNTAYQDVPGVEPAYKRVKVEQAPEVVKAPPSRAEYAAARVQSLLDRASAYNQLSMIDGQELDRLLKSQDLPNMLKDDSLTQTDMLAISRITELTRE